MNKVYTTAAYLLAALAGVFLLLPLTKLHARLVGVQYYDRGSINPETSGGPMWTGVVDTFANTLQINTWRELPAHGADFWVPADLPIVWTARDSNGDVYDVPFDFGSTVVPGSPPSLTAEIGADFGFFSELTLADMTWDEGAYTSASGPSIIPGWGGVALEDALSGEFVYYTDTSPFSTEALDETILLLLPVSATSENISREATITVVPEASAFLGFVLIGMLSATSLWLRRCQPNGK